MEIFISMKVSRGNILREQLAGLIAEAALQAGHTPFVATQEIARRGLTPQQFMPFVRQRIQQAGLVIVIYDAELRGGLIEEGIAYADGVPIWLLHRQSEQVSSSARACAERVIEYESLDELGELLIAGLSAGG
jgi:hypothetical protein